MPRFLIGLLCGGGLLAGLAFAWMRGDDGCLGRCGDGTRCANHHCIAALTAPPPSATKEPHRRRRHAAGDPLAPAEVQLKPGDEKMVAQGDALGRPERIDLSAKGGDDGRELQQEDLDRVFHPSEPSILRCITDSLGDAPLESGKVEVGLRVERTGQVSRVRVEGPALLQRNGLHRCIRGVVSLLRFPASGGASVVTYPFELK